MKTATISDSGSLREIEFSVSSPTYEDQYTIHWTGYCVLQNLYAPNGVDLLQRPKENVWDGFKWGFVYVSFNPKRVASSYGYDGAGLWRIRMQIVDPTVPSLYKPDGFRISIHRMEWTSREVYLPVGQSYTMNLASQSNWYTSGSWYGIYANANSSQVDVSNSLLRYSYGGYSTDKTRYDYSYWWTYNHTFAVTNIFAEPLTVQIYFYTCLYRNIEHETTSDGLEFTLNSEAFDNGRASNYFSLDIAANSPIKDRALYTPNGNRAEELYRNIVYTDFDHKNDEYYTLRVVYGLRDEYYTRGTVYGANFNPYYAWKVLENNIYGTWRLASLSTDLHDVAVTLTPYRTVADQGFCTNVTVVVENRGSMTETVDLMVSEGSCSIGSQLGLVLNGGESIRLKFVWNTTMVAKGNCTLLATASPVQNETNNENNNSTCCIEVSIKGDIDANGKVNILDISRAASAFGSYPELSKWYANADVNEDEKINIMDISTIAKEFGKTI